MKKVIYFIILMMALHLTSEAQVSLPNLQAMQYVNSDLGNALNFDGVGSYALGKAYLKDSLVDFTIEFWIKNTGSDVANDRIYGSYFNNALQIGKSTTNLTILATDLGGPSTWETVTTLPANTWVHMAFIRGGTSLKVYKNAGLVKTISLTSSSTILPSLFRLGSNSNGAGSQAIISTYTLGAVGNSDYTFTGPGFTGSASDPAIYLVRGQQYKFTNTMGMHPFRIQTSVNGSAGVPYNNGVTNNDVSNGTLTFNVPMDVPEVLYYQCTAHGSMGGPIYILDQSPASSANANFSIDELRIWKIAVPTNFIQKYMFSSINPNATSDQNPSTKLVLYYKFDQGIFGQDNSTELGLYNSAISN